MYGAGRFMSGKMKRMKNKTDKRLILWFYLICMLLIMTGCGSANSKVVTGINSVKDETKEDTSSEINAGLEEENEDTEVEVMLPFVAASEEEKTDVDMAVSENDTANAYLEAVLGEMTLRQKVCQMMFVNPESITKTSYVTVAGDATRAALEEYAVGGIMYSKPNLLNGEQVTEMIANTQSYSTIGLFIAADEEGGTVNRLMATLGTTYINSMYNYKDDGTDVAYDNAYTIAMDMQNFGFNLDFAPVADVWSNPDNTVIGRRAYSDDFNQAAELIPYAVNGFHEGGVMCTLKHFPGHGNTEEDSHTGSAYVNRTLEELENEEFLPFKAGIEAGAEFVMVGHLIVSDIDELPATLSEKIVTGILREELGYQGIIITDSFEMNAISDNYSSREAAVMAVKAGVDMILEPANLDEAIDGIVEAVENGDISEERIDESVERILTVKMEYGLLNSEIK
jgi:beta-N-acetylhexosaminidase